jgi:hypothetical protein
MKIAMTSRWNIPCGVSLHAELVGRAWVEMGHDLQVLAPVEWEGYQSDAAISLWCKTLRSCPWEISSKSTHP